MSGLRNGGADAGRGDGSRPGFFPLASDCDSALARRTVLSCCGWMQLRRSRYENLAGQSSPDRYAD